MEELRSSQNFFVKNKGKILKLLIVLIIVSGFTLGCYFLFDTLGLSDAQNLNIEGFWIYIIFVCLFVVQAICLCMIPGNTTIFIYLALTLFDFHIALLVCVVGVWLGGIALFFIGRFGGRRVLYWLFGKEPVEKNLDWVTRKGVTALPAFFLVPFMPNDMVCMVCGMSKLKFWQFLMIIIPFRVVEVLMILSYTPLFDFFTKDQPPQVILMFINILIIDVVLIAMYYKVLIRIFRKTIVLWLRRTS